MSTLEENKRLARRFYIEPLEDRRSSVLDELVTDDYVDADAESAEEKVPGPEGVKRVNDRFLAAFTDIRVTIEDQIAEGDKVVTRWSAEGTTAGSSWVSRRRASASTRRGSRFISSATGASLPNGGVGRARAAHPARRHRASPGPVGLGRR